MNIEAFIITPVKDALTNTLQVIESVQKSEAAIKHYVFNDFSTQVTKDALLNAQNQYGYSLVHIEDLTDHPSPNYKLVLTEAQKESLAHKRPFILVESDVEVKPETFRQMLDFYQANTNIGLLAAITVDQESKINFPYLRFKNINSAKGYVETKKSLSFCCTLISPEFLAQYDFSQLNEAKDWYDTFLSDQSLKLGFRNVLLTNTKVLHKPHGSRPWKNMKYKNPFKYYFLKLLKNRDKI